MIELTQEEIKTLLEILDQIPLRGIENMNTVLGIVKKLAQEVEHDSGD